MNEHKQCESETTSRKLIKMAGQNTKCNTIKLVPEVSHVKRLSSVPVWDNLNSYCFAFASPGNKIV